MAVIEVEGLAKSFGARRVLGSVSFSVEPGSMLAVTGPSGSGKTTLLNCVGLLDRYDDGEIVVAGQRLTRISRQERVRFFRSTVGYLFQNYALIDNDTVDKNLDVACAYADRDAGGKREWKAEALDRVGLSDKLKSRVFELSGGEQQRVAMARLLVRKLPVVLADEPTGALDATNRDMILELLGGLRDEGAAVLIVTHDPAVVAACDDQLVLMGH